MNDPVPTQRIVLVGGRRHGEEIEVQEGQNSWVDLLSAETYLRNAFSYVRRDPADPMNEALIKGYSCDAMVHESIAADRSAANQWWMALALERLFLSIGREVPKEQVLQAPRPQSPNGKAELN